MQSIDDLQVMGRRVLLRSDLNVPLDLTGTGQITDDGRIRASLPVISKLSDRGARVLILAHLGLPKGGTFEERAAGGPSLRPVAARLGELLGRPVSFATDVAGPSAEETAFSLGDEDVAVLENVRFEPAETSKDDAERGAFARRLARLGEVYVGDGFGAVHRKHASVYDLPLLLPHAAGDLVRDEVAVLRQLTTDPARPFVVVLGGKKPSDKLAVIGNLLNLADRILIGGGMAYTFLAAQGYEVGNSVLEAEQIPAVREVMAEAERRGVELVLPVDLVVATHFAPDAEHSVVPATEIPPDREGVDAGPQTRALFAREAGRRQDGVLERPARGVRVPGLRGRHPGARRGGGRGGRADRGGRRRLGRGSPRPGHPGEVLQPHLHRRRREPGVPRGQDAARAGCAGGWSVTARTRGSGGSGRSGFRLPLMAGNWKMHMNHLEAIALVQKLAFTLTEKDFDAVEVAVLPPFTALRSVQTLIDGDKLRISYGAQDLSQYDSGAYTGDVSGPMLAKLGCQYVLAGHSERRQYHGETDDVVNAKALAALRSGLTPILCLGEPLEVRQARQQLGHCMGQLDEGLKGFPAAAVAAMVIAYEPVWAIGTGEVATPEDAQETAAAIRSRVSEFHDAATAASVRILYGGSVKPGNIAPIMAQPDVDGALVGGASLDAGQFAQICRYRELAA